MPVALVCAAVLAAASPAGAGQALGASPGSLDPRFGGDGRVTAKPAKHGGEVSALAVQADGKVLAAGNGVEWYGTNTTQGTVVSALYRYRRNGRLDRRWGRDGRVRVPWMGRPADIAIQPDGRVVVVGNRWVESDGELVAVDPIVARYRRHGRPDRTFGGGDGVMAPTFGADEDRVSDVLVQDDGRLVLVGRSRDIYCSPGGCEDAFVLARYHPDGTPDPSFGDAGLVRRPLDPLDRVIGSRGALLADGSILVSGSRVIRVPGPAGDDYQFALQRYRPDGELDTGYGDGGTAVHDLGGQYQIPAAMAATPDGTALVAGTMRGAGGLDDFALLRVDPEGDRDPGFGADGAVVTDVRPRDDAADVELDGAGRILVAGRSGRDFSAGRVTVLRYLADGSLDAAFGEAGVARTRFKAGSSGANDAALAPSGRIVAGGYAGERWALARYLP